MAMVTRTVSILFVKVVVSNPGISLRIINSSTQLPSGGLENQVLAKASDTDFHTKWLTGGTGGVSDAELDLAANSDLKLSREEVLINFFDLPQNVQKHIKNRIKKYKSFLVRILRSTKLL